MKRFSEETRKNFMKAFGVKEVVFGIAALQPDGTERSCDNCNFKRFPHICAEGDCEDHSCWEPVEINQSAKSDDGKPRPTLVPASLIRAVTEIREYGCKKYHDPENWRKVEPQRYRDALYRHWLAYLEGEVNDPESGLPHIWHVACNVAFLIEMEGTK